MLLRLALAALLLAAPLQVRAETAVPQSQPQIALSFAPVVRAAAPAVVNIYATRVVEQSVSPFAGDPFFDQFFQDFGRSEPRVQNSLGSGVIVAPEGIVVSNYHVVEQATEIRVVLNDRREYPARVLLADKSVDLAVLRLEGAADLPALPFRDSDQMQVGDLVLAIGNPFGVGQTVSSGIVSGLARSAFQLGDGRGYFIQTDAPINPGNSGGALVDVGGRLVGINTAILTRSGGSNGIGFAIPSNLVAVVVAQARAGATRFEKPWAGVAAQAVDAAMADAMNLGLPRGVVLTQIAPASPFAAAGLKAGDVVISLAGFETNTPQEMMFRMNTLGPGHKVPLTWLHDGEERTTDLQLAAAPDEPPREETRITDDLALRGATLLRLNPAVLGEYDLPPDAEGVLVAAVSDIAASVGLQAGDVLVAVNGIPVTRPAEVTDVLQQGGRRWALDLVRQGKTMRLRFRL
jgi:Do/DeqQ family serine protease